MAKTADKNRGERREARTGQSHTKKGASRDLEPRGHASRVKGGIGPIDSLKAAGSLPIGPIDSAR